MFTWGNYVIISVPLILRILNTVSTMGKWWKGERGEEEGGRLIDLYIVYYFIIHIYCKALIFDLTIWKKVSVEYCK